MGGSPYSQPADSQNCHTQKQQSCYDDCMKNMNAHPAMITGFEGPQYNMFNPMEHIEVQDDGFALCTNPMADGGLSAITVNTRLNGEALQNFEASIRRMVLSKLFSPKFGEVILTATRLNHAH
jgi:hypothetical protein